MFHTRRRLALLAALLLGPLPAAFAQAGPPSFAVLSEVAREVRVTVFRQDIGTRLGANLEDRLPANNGAFDKVVLVTSKSALAAAAPGAPVWLIAPTDSDLFDYRNNFVEGSTVPIPADLAQALKERGSTQLLLFTRHRAEATLRGSTVNMGSGQIEGLGFYIDGQAEITNRDTRVTSIGFIAPYVYMRATLIDVASGKVLKTRRVTQSRVRAAEKAEQSNDPWNVLTPAQKSRLLADMLVDEVNQSVQALVPRS